jgi:Rieske Fe-S protein
MEEKLTTRRKVLIGMTAAVGSAGIPFAAVPFLSAWNPSAKAKAVGAPVKVDISKIQVGQKNSSCLEKATSFRYQAFKRGSSKLITNRRKA